MWGIAFVSSRMCPWMKELLLWKCRRTSRRLIPIWDAADEMSCRVDVYQCIHCLHLMRSNAVLWSRSAMMPHSYWSASEMILSLNPWRVPSTVTWTSKETERTVSLPFLLVRLIREEQSNNVQFQSAVAEMFECRISTWWLWHIVEWDEKISKRTWMRFKLRTLVLSLAEEM